MGYFRNLVSSYWDYFWSYIPSCLFYLEVVILRTVNELVRILFIFLTWKNDLIKNVTLLNNDYCRFAHPYLAYMMFVPCSLAGMLFPRICWNYFPLSQAPYLVKSSKQVWFLFFASPLIISRSFIIDNSKFYTLTNGFVLKIVGYGNKMLNDRDTVS